MTEAELRNKYAVRIAWSNSQATMEQLLSAALLTPKKEMLVDFIDTLGFDKIRQRWSSMKAQPTHNDEILMAWPYVEDIFAELGYEHDNVTNTDRNRVAEIRKRKIADRFL